MGAFNPFASAGAAKLAVRDRFELGAILPTGAVYTFVRNRNLFKKGLKIMKRIRCSVQPGAAECSNNAEIEWAVVAQR